MIEQTNKQINGCMYVWMNKWDLASEYSEQITNVEKIQDNK